MKKSLIILLAAMLLAASLSACSKRTGDSSGESGESAPESSMESAQDAPVRPSVSEAAANNELKDQSEITLIQFETPAVGAPVATVKTNMGEIKFVLYPERAPRAVENFVRLAEDGFYNGKVIHFAQDGYMIQTGAVNSNGTGSRSVFQNADGEQQYFEAEPSWDLWHFRGALSVANTSGGLCGSQFSIIQSSNIYGFTEQDLQDAKFPQSVIDKYGEIGGVPHQDGYNTVFGMVTEGMDIVDEMMDIETDAVGMPMETILIESVTIENAPAYAGSDADAESADETGGEESAA